MIQKSTRVVRPNLGRRLETAGRTARAANCGPVSTGETNDELLDRDPASFEGGSSERDRLRDTPDGEKAVWKDRSLEVVTEKTRAKIERSRTPPFESE